MACADRRLSRCVLLALAMALLAVAAPPVVRRQRTVRVVVDRDYPPYSYQPVPGRLQGIVVDQWRAWERKTGIRAELVPLDWGDAVRRMQHGEFDVIDCIIATEKRKAYLDFTEPYATVEASIFFRAEVSGITDLSSLEGFPVGVQAGDQHIDRLKERSVTTLIQFRSNGDVIRAAQDRKINVFVIDIPVALYLLNKAGVAGQFRRTQPVFRDRLRRAVRKGDTAMLDLVTRGFAAIDPAELERIDEAWFGHPIELRARYFIYAGYIGAVAFLIIAGLFFWNRLLARRVEVRTATLRETEERFRQIAENIREVFWLVDVDSGKLLYVSPAYEAVWGRPARSLYEDVNSFVAAIHPDDRLRVTEATERRREGGFEVEYRVVQPGGSIRWIWDRGFPIRDGKGRVYRLAGIAEDITERKAAADAVRESEDRKRVLIDTIPVMVWGLRGDHSMEFLNQRWLDYTGLTAVEAIASPNAVVHPADLPRVMERWRRTSAEGVVCEDEMRLRGADGEYHWFLIRTVPLRDEHGVILNWFGTSVDIGDRRRIEDELRGTTEQLRALSARVQSAREEEGIRIAREIHDELGATLTTLRWELEGIRKASSEPERTAHETHLPEQLSGMLELTDTMIAIVRRIASDLRPVVLDVLGLKEAIEWQSRQFQERTGITVRCESGGAGFALTSAKSTAVFRIFQEALTNILRHANATRVDVAFIEDSGVFVLLVGDNGRGITESERTSARSIGLLGMRERAHLIGGDIDVAGVDGEGTTVTLRVPLGAASTSPS